MRIVNYEIAGADVTKRARVAVIETPAVSICRMECARYPAGVSCRRLPSGGAEQRHFVVLAGGVQICPQPGIEIVTDRDHRTLPPFSRKRSVRRNCAGGRGAAGDGADQRHRCRREPPARRNRVGRRRDRGRPSAAVCAPARRCSGVEASATRFLTPRQSDALEFASFDLVERVHRSSLSNWTQMLGARTTVEVKAAILV
jgi:hypothetical protein